MKTQAIESEILVGASWYPEMWPESEWPKDAARMRELGYNMTRMFEFAWHRLEPREGHFDMGWALRAMDVCHKNGIRVMAGTPTAAPPSWLTTKYPEVLRTEAGGSRCLHGRRCHRNFHSHVYREFCSRIAGTMAKAFAGHPALHSWQIDNEMAGYDYGPETEALFREALRKRFGTIEAMNEAWGLEFWSQAYDSFETVRLARADVGGREVQERDHPSLVMAAAEFQNAGWEEYIRVQCEAIRAHSDVPISTNMVGTMAMDWYRHNRLMDAVGTSMYSDVAHYGDRLSLFDRMRAEKDRPYWLMETAPGWSAAGRIWNIHMDDRGPRLIAWLSTLMGGSMVLFWQWRQHWAGQEMLHGTLVNAAGRWLPNWQVHRRLAAELAAHGRWLLANPPARARVAIMHDTRAAWALSIDPHDEDMDYPTRWNRDFHAPLAEEHVWRDVIDASRNLDPYKVLIMPLMPIAGEDLRARLTRWVRDGGHLLIGPMTGIRTPDMTVWRDREFGGLEDLIGASSACQFTVKWVEDRVEVMYGDRTSAKTRAWCHGFACTTASPLAVYRGGYGDGHPAVVRNRFGRGTVTTLGCMPDRQSYVRLVREILAEAGVAPVAEGSPRVQVVPRADASGRVSGYGLFNLAGERQSIRIGSFGMDVLSKRKAGPDIEMEPYGVALVIGE
jgi:beta-galactosidase GanA